MVSQRSASIDESKSGKRERDSAFGHPRPDPVDPESTSYQPQLSDPDETTLKSFETVLFRVLTHHVVYPFMNFGDPTPRVKIMDKDVSMFLDTTGLQLVHPFFYVDAEIPALGGYDLFAGRANYDRCPLRGSLSKHPDVAYQASCLENIFVTVPSQSTPNGNLSSLTDEKTPVPCVVSDATSYPEEYALACLWCTNTRFEPFYPDFPCPGRCAADCH